jgi:hypothetical protein
MTTIFFFFSPLSFIAVFGSEIRDPGWVKSGSGIRNKHPGSATLHTKTRGEGRKTCLQRKPIGLDSVGSGMFIVVPDPGSEFFPSGSRVKKISDPGSGSKNVSKLLEKLSGCSSRIRIFFHP